MTEKEAKVVVMQARQRVHGIGESSAGLAEAGSALGRLYLAGAITKRLYESGNRFAEDVWAYHALTGIPHPSPRAIDYGRVRGLGRDSSPEAVKRATNRYMNVLGVIQQSDKAGRPVETTLRNVVLLDMDASNWPPHMVKMLARVLTALAEWYGIPESEEDRIKYWEGRRDPKEGMA